MSILLDFSILHVLVFKDISIIEGKDTTVVYTVTPLVVNMSII